MRSVLLSFSLAALVSAQGPGGGGPESLPEGSFSHRPVRSAPVRSGAGPQASRWVVPAAYANVMGNWANRFPFGHKDMRYQQVFLGSELRQQGTWRGVGLRQAATAFGRPGGRVRLSISIGRTTLSHTNLSTSFAANANRGAMQKVADNVWYNIPDFAGNNNNAASFAAVLPFERPHVYSPTAGENVLIEFVNTTPTGHLLSFLDAANGGPTTSRVYAFSPTATTGTVFNSGLIMCFLDSVKTQADFGPFGTACAGTRTSDGTILPAISRNYMGNDSNIFGHSAADQRYQQVFLGTELGGRKLLTGHAFRRDQSATHAGGPITIEVLMSLTSAMPTTMSLGFGANPKGAQTTVIKKKAVNTPALPPNDNPRDFAVRIPWDTPWTWSPQAGDNLLYECRNYDMTRVSQWFDAHSGGNTGRIWGSPVTALNASGSTSDYGLVMQFLHRGAGNAAPLMGNVGRPLIGKTMDVFVWDAKANGAAILVWGVSNKMWGPIPLPFDLTAIGAAGCNLHVSFDAIFGGTATDAKGTGKVAYTIPNLPALSGLTWHQQWLVLDNANSLGITVSEGATARIGEQ